MTTAAALTDQVTIDREPENVTETLGSMAVRR
jgi:hypothetical protein